MKKILFFLLTWIPLLATAQSDRVVDTYGNLLYQYSRTVETTSDNSLRVVFIFSNGTKQTALSLRQETMNGKVSWTKKDNGNTRSEKIVESCTANLKPNQSVTWQYLYTPLKTTSAPTLERSALMIMQDDFRVQKIILPNKTDTTTIVPTLKN